MIHSSVKIELTALKKYRKILDQDLRSGGQKSGGSPVNNAFKQWGIRVRSFLQERFLIFSRGGGNWPPLKPSTIRRRRGALTKKGKLKKGFKASILIDTGQLFHALDPVFTGKPGAIEESIPYGIRVGYGGPGRYTKKYGGIPTIADIASFHQTGAGHLPKREIIVKPDQHTINLMEEDMERAIGKLHQKARQ